MLMEERAAASHMTNHHVSPLTLTASAQLVRKTNIIIPLVEVTLASRKSLQNYGAESAAVFTIEINNV